MFLSFIVVALAGLYVGGRYELKLKTKGGLNVTYTDDTGATKNLF